MLMATANDGGLVVVVEEEEVADRQSRLALEMLTQTRRWETRAGGWAAGTGPIIRRVAGRWLLMVLLGAAAVRAPT